MTYRARCTGRRTADRFWRRRDRRPDLLLPIQILMDAWPQTTLPDENGIMVTIRRPWWAREACRRRWMTASEYLAVPRELEEHRVPGWGPAWAPLFRRAG